MGLPPNSGRTGRNCPSCKKPWMSSYPPPKIVPGEYIIGAELNQVIDDFDTTRQATRGGPRKRDNPRKRDRCDYFDA